MTDLIITACMFFILLGSIFLSFSLRFVQLRILPQMMKMLFTRKQSERSHHEISPHKALFTAMSTTIGVGNITCPIIAMGLGGPGALIGFVLVTIFGCAVTFAEVSFALSYRKRLPDGRIMGGPMQYLSDGIHPLLGKLYGWAGFILLVAWSSAQSNTLAVLLEPYGIAKAWTGLFLAVTIVAVLLGGIKRIGSFNGKLIPIMFFLYCGATSWIICAHLEQLPAVCKLICNSFFSWQTAAGAAAGVGMLSALRHGLARALQTNEAGVGTSTFPHSMAGTKDPVQQGILAMVAVYSNGLLCLLTGFTVLLSGVFTSGLPYDATMLSKVLADHFGAIGPFLLIVSAFLFAFGTILGNSYNGSQCYLFITQNRWLKVYYGLIALSVFLGCISEVKLVWTLMDYFVIPVAVPHMIGLLILSVRQRRLLMQRQWDAVPHPAKGT